MNYTGRPSISGCRPVLSLYPTHRFCQYLLLIFITFTNSSLFNRAFSTNSRRALSHAAGVTALGCALSGASRQLPQRERSSTSPSLLRNATARVAAPSVCFAAARILLAAAPTAPPCFRHWRRSSPLLPPRGGFGRAHRSLYLFGELYVIMVLRPCPPILFGREVKAMSSILSFVLSVGANVTSYYICKWLDRWFTGRKH